MISLLLIILSDHAAMALTADTVVNPRVNLNWTSQTFIFPPGVFPNDTGSCCGKYSKYYCLHAYETRLTRSAAIAAHHGALLTDVNQANHPGHGNQEATEDDDLAIEYEYLDLDVDEVLSQHVQTLKAAAYELCLEVTRPMHEQHNHFIEQIGCCWFQCNYYLVHGYDRMFLSPQEYIEKLTDYSTRCNRNVITKVGFGKGDLVRRDYYLYGTRAHRFGYPYLLSSLDESLAYWFPYNDPRSQLTYWWFKHNIICREQPWICHKSGEKDSASELPKGQLESNIDQQETVQEIVYKMGCEIC
ncbi:uncharacterized protein LOC142340855 isoform X2 [Convolutriloba macropyga]|uniref:uncharacterized protein LOC142340855 isoform X2 n=1 Tax=Convolutriloba macropyga TaxID=536237 RepID=UPI003F525F9B